MANTKTKTKNDKKWACIEKYRKHKWSKEKICKKENVTMKQLNGWLSFEYIDNKGKYRDKTEDKFTFVDNIYRKTRFGQCQK
jgi:hypothetical protein